MSNGDLAWPKIERIDGSVGLLSATRLLDEQSISTIAEAIGQSQALVPTRPGNFEARGGGISWLTENELRELFVASQKRDENEFGQNSANSFNAHTYNQAQEVHTEGSVLQFRVAEVKSLKHSKHSKWHLMARLEGDGQDRIFAERAAVVVKLAGISLEKAPPRLMPDWSALLCLAVARDPKVAGRMGRQLNEELAGGEIRLDRVHLGIVRYFRDRQLEGEYKKKKRLSYLENQRQLTE